MTMRSDTKALLRTGLWIFGVGAISAALMLFAFGGVTKQGPHTNLGWLTLMIAMGCLPTGTLTLFLAALKIAGDRNRQD